MPKHNLTYLGFDFGTKRIGVAVGQDITCSAQALTTLSANNGTPQWPEIQKIIDQWQAHALVVGIPLHMDGSEQGISHKARHFAKCLKQQFGLPVFEAEERLSTIEAREQLFKSKTPGKRNPLASNKAIDGYAAKIILQCWLQQRNPE